MSLQKGFFKTQSSNPILPPEEWTLDEEFTTAGSYSTSLDWGKYKIVISGGGGAGGASASTHDTSRNWANAGSAGEELTIMVSVPNGENKTVSGIIASGGGTSYAYAHKTYSGGTVTATLGAIGTGYGNGTQGTRATYIVPQPTANSDCSAGAGGSGGGSTSLEIDGILNSVARGGNGGACRADQISARAGGTGGSGGISGGTGAAGGGGAYYRNGGGYSGAGSDGYVRVYKSNLYPEPL